MCTGRLLARLSEPLAREAMRAARALLAVAAGQSIYYQIDRSERNLPEYSGEVRPIRREKVDLAVKLNLFAGMLTVVGQGEAAQDAMPQLRAHIPKMIQQCQPILLTTATTDLPI